MIAKIKRWFTGYTPETALQREQRKNVSLHFELAAANKRADEQEASADAWHARYLAVLSELDAIKKQRSDTVRRGNITRRLKREAARTAA